MTLDLTVRVEQAGTGLKQSLPDSIIRLAVVMPASGVAVEHGEHGSSKLMQDPAPLVSAAKQAPLE